jgi:hypothetical protein
MLTSCGAPRWGWGRRLLEGWRGAIVGLADRDCRYIAGAGHHPWHRARVLGIDVRPSMLVDSVPATAWGGLTRLLEDVRRQPRFHVAAV